MLRLVQLGHNQPVGRLDLTPAERLADELRQPMQAVHADDGLADHDVMDQHRVGADRLEDRAGIGKAAGLQHDLVEPRLAGQRCGCGCRTGAAAAATSSALASQQAQPPASTSIAEARESSASSTGVAAASLTMTCAPAKAVCVKLVPQPGGLAGAEEPAEQGQAHTAVGRRTLQPSVASLAQPRHCPETADRADRSACPIMRSAAAPDLLEIARDGLVAEESADLDAGHLRRHRGP